MAKTLFGKVTSDVADKTIVVTVTSRETHPIYKKQRMRLAKVIWYASSRLAQSANVRALRYKISKSALLAVLTSRTTLRR